MAAGWRGRAARRPASAGADGGVNGPAQRKCGRCCRKSTRCRKPIEISEAGAAQMHEQVGGHPGEWTLRRSFCLNRLAQLYGRMPLVTTNCSFGVMSNH